MKVRPMKRFIAAILAALSLLGAAPAFAWDGTVTGTAGQVDISYGGNLDFRIYLTSGALMCTGGQAFAYVNEADANYKGFVAALLQASALGKTVTIFSTTVGGWCHIGYVSVAP